MSKSAAVILVAAITTMVFAGCAQLAVAGGGPEQAPTLLSQSTLEPYPKTINVSGTGTASARPDLAFVDLGVGVVSQDPAKAADENAEKMAAVMDVIQEMDIEEEDVQTIGYNMWLEQIYDKEGQPTGEIRYHVVNQVRVRLEDLPKLGELLRKAMEAGANTVGGVSFGVSDPTALRQEARDKAVADAKAKAEQLATGMGVKLGALRSVSEYGVSPIPISQFGWDGRGGGGGGGPVPMSGGEFSVGVEINATFDIAE